MSIEIRDGSPLPAYKIRFPLRDEAQQILDRVEAIKRYLDEAGEDQTATRAINEQIKRELESAKSEIADVGVVVSITSIIEKQSRFNRLGAY